MQVPLDTAPTDRELEILEVLWERGEATVREVYDALGSRLGIVQNTVQAFLRTMEEKKLVDHRLEGRTFIYRPLVERDPTKQKLISRLVQRVFGGALDQFVQSALSVHPPDADELKRIEDVLRDYRVRQTGKRAGGKAQ